MEGGELIKQSLREQLSEIKQSIARLYDERNVITNKDGRTPEDRARIMDIDREVDQLRETQRRTVAEVVPTPSAPLSLLQLGDVDVVVWSKDIDPCIVSKLDEPSKRQFRLVSKAARNAVNRSISKITFHDIEALEVASDGAYPNITKCTFLFWHKYFANDDGTLNQEAYNRFITALKKFVSRFSSQLERLDITQIYIEAATDGALKRVPGIAAALASTPDWPRLEWLALEGLQLNGSDMLELHKMNMPGLNLLSLSKNSLGYRGVSKLKGAPFLASIHLLDLSLNALGKRIDVLTETSIPNLETLILTRDRLNKEAMNTLAKAIGMPNLCCLDVKDNFLPDDAFEAVRKRWPDLEIDAANECEGYVDIDCEYCGGCVCGLCCCPCGTDFKIKKQSASVDDSDDDYDEEEYDKGDEKQEELMQRWMDSMMGMLGPILNGNNNN